MALVLHNPAWLHGVMYSARTRQHVIDGRPAPSVTQVLDRAKPDRFARVRPAALARAAAIGTAVHTAAHLLAEGDLDETSIAPEVQSRLDAWRWFTATRQVEPLLSEATVCSRDLGLPAARRWPYVGRLDLLCLVDRRSLVLLDIKTGRPWLAQLQTLAYLDALYQQFPVLIPLDVQRWAVCLTARGAYQIHEFRADALDARDYRALLAEAYDAPDSPWRRRPDDAL